VGGCHGDGEHGGGFSKADGTGDEVYGRLEGAPSAGFAPYCYAFGVAVEYLAVCDVVVLNDGRTMM